MEIFCSQSFSKNFGLYNEREVNLTIVFKDASVLANIRSQLIPIVSGMYLNPPAHGAHVAKMVLNNDKLFAEWKDNIKPCPVELLLWEKVSEIS